MSSSLVAIAIDCAEAPAVARFWAHVLGRQVAEDSTSERVILLLGDGGTGGPHITFNKVPEPKTVKNRALQFRQRHLRRRDRTRAEPGAPKRLRDLQRDKSRWTTFADIERNEFDLIAG